MSSFKVYFVVTKKYGQILQSSVKAIIMHINLQILNTRIIVIFSSSHCKLWLKSTAESELTKRIKFHFAIEMLARLQLWYYLQCQAYTTIFLKGFPTLSEKSEIVTQALFLSLEFVIFQYIYGLLKALNENKTMFVTTSHAKIF